ncbi:MAG TPA: acyl-CoA desaturase [Candidatus Thermoplasmatota archaeon]|nr:acyl-CoA desaturase [Candidatus Thermoplasmatota archaeon]
MDRKKDEAQREWDQEPDPAAADAPTADPFPFHHDPWWGKALVLTVVFLPLAALGYIGWRLWGDHFSLLDLWLLLGFWAFTGLGISVGFHRMLTHRAFEARPVTRFFLLVAGTMSLQGPPADWAATHIRHHAKADREGDPHSPLEGFWHAHTAWLVRDRFVRQGLAHDKLMADPVTRLIQRTWAVWVILTFALPAAIALLVTHSWWGALDGAVWGGLVRVFIGHHITWSVNSVTHMFGTRPFRTPDQARNNWLIAFLGWGEGWHNNHHAFPNSAFIGMRWYQIDIGAWLIQLLRGLGQIRKLEHPTREQKAARLRRPRRTSA